MYETYECDYCGCVFEATGDEIMLEPYPVIECPVCGRMTSAF